MVDPCYSHQTLERCGNRGVDEVQASMLLTKGAACQNCAQTCRINEVDSLKIEDDFAHPIRADGFQRSVELRRAVQVHLPAEKQHAALAPACDLDLKHLPSTPATVLVPVRDAPAVPRSLTATASVLPGMSPA